MKLLKDDVHRIFGIAAVILISFLAFIIQPAAAQTHVTGKVITADSVPVQNAIVKLRSMDSSTHEFSTLTDQFGNFSFLIPTGLDAPEPVQDFILHQNYPNPFTNETTIPFELKAGSHVRLDILDVLGRRVRRLLDDYRGSGNSNVSWDGTDDAGRETDAGVYFSMLASGNRCLTSKIVRGIGGTVGMSVFRKSSEQVYKASALNGSAMQLEMEVLDTSIASPHFYSLKKLAFPSNGDTSLTLIVYTEDRWRFLGLDSVYIERLLLKDSILYACTRGRGLARMNVKDSLSGWEYLSFKMPNTDEVYDVLIDPNNPRHLMATCGKWYTAYSRILASNDSGYTWSRADSGLISRDVLRLKLSHGKIIGIGDHSFFSTNFGTSWISIPSGPRFDYSNILEQHLTNEDLIFCAGLRPIVGNSWMFFTKDGGQMWQWSDNFITGSTGSLMSSIGLSSGTPPTLYITLSWTLAKSKDDGLTWHEVLHSSTGPPKYLYINSIIVNNVNNNEVWCGGEYLYHSIDEGDAWTIIGTPIEKSSRLITSITPNYIGWEFYVGTDMGVYWFRP